MRRTTHIVHWHCCGRSSSSSASTRRPSKAFLIQRRRPSRSNMTVNEDPLPKGFVRAYFTSDDRTVFLNKVTQVAQWDHPGEDGAGARPRISQFPMEKPKKDIPILFSISPQPPNMPNGWEQCVAVLPGRKVDWVDPHILYRNSADHAIQEADPRPNDVEDELPAGWTKETDLEGDQFFYDHDTGIATYDDPRYVEDPQPCVALQALLSARAARRKSQFEKDAPSKKTWVIGAKDVKAFEAIDNYLTQVEEIPEAVRNKKHNRYMDILPNPRTAITLPMIGDDEGSAYVNANYVRGPEGQPRFYVAAMGPLPGTVTNFWRMIWETRTAAIIMVTGLVEKGRVKCERYWPAEVDNKTTMKFGDIEVISQQEAKARGYVYTLLKVRRGSEVRKVGHFWYNSWPDHGVPRDAENAIYPDSVLGMLHTVHKWCSKLKDRPILVHCSAGVGRTGTIIAIDHCRYGLKHLGRADPLHSIDLIRQDRCALVQHPIQFKFVHAACTKYAELHKHAFTVERAAEASEDAAVSRVRRMSVIEREAEIRQQKTAARSRAREGSVRRNIMTKSQMHGELRLNARHAPSTAPPKQDWETLWQIFDLDGDGLISMREARMQGIDIATFRAIDTDGNGVITLQEFKAYYEKQMEATS
eukprot:m.74047 g.74047  ORF g.74047 m.74047 type:complete len:642 (-) comp13924_c2_seq1:319-2244(-)